MAFRIRPTSIKPSQFGPCPSTPTTLSCQTKPNCMVFPHILATPCLHDGLKSLPQLGIPFPAPLPQSKRQSTSWPTKLASQPSQGSLENASEARLLPGPCQGNERLWPGDIFIWKSSRRSSAPHFQPWAGPCSDDLWLP